MHQSIDNHEGKKYLRKIRPADGKGQPILVDIYQVLDCFGVHCQARGQAIKKLLCCGSRGKGNEMADLNGALAALCRAIDLQKDREADAKSAHPDGKPASGPKYLAGIADQSDR